MIKGFEHITKPLSNEEKDLIPVIVKGFKFHVGKQNIISGKEIIKRMTSNNYKINEARLRKIINYIRSNGIAPICSNARGYWYSNSINEMKSQIESLKQRSLAIDMAAHGLEIFINEYYKSKQISL